MNNQNPKQMSKNSPIIKTQHIDNHNEGSSNQKNENESIHPIEPSNPLQNSQNRPPIVDSSISQIQKTPEIPNEQSNQDKDEVIEASKLILEKKYEEAVSLCREAIEKA